MSTIRSFIDPQFSENGPGRVFFAAEVTIEGWDDLTLQGLWNGTVLAPIEAADLTEDDRRQIREYLDEQVESLRKVLGAS